MWRFRQRLTPKFFIKFHQIFFNVLLHELACVNKGREILAQYEKVYISFFIIYEF